MSANFGSKDGILIRIMTLEDYKHIEGRIYDDEPLLSSAGENTHDLLRCDEQYFYDFHIKIIEQDTSLVAINENDGGRIVGFVLAESHVPSDLKRHREEADDIDLNSWSRIVLYMSIVEAKANIFERYGVSKILYSHMTYVDGSFRGKGIGYRLAVALMELGKSKGFPMIMASCTSFYSARQKEALGMECVYSEAYEDYKDANGEVVFKTVAPHTHLRIMAKKL